MTEYAGVIGLGERISNLKLTNAEGKTVGNRRFIPGEYVADGEFRNWSYTVDLTPLGQQTAAAHISWVTDGVGLLMLDDLLPQNITAQVPGRVRIDLPAGWKICTNETAIPRVINNVTVLGYRLVDPAKTSVLIGKDVRQKDVVIGETRLHLAITGEWHFSDDAAARMATEIFEHYSKVFGPSPTNEAQIALIKFPGNVLSGNWEGDTRGNSITIVSSDMPFESQSLQFLHEQLRHEIFHLWFPNGVNLSGNYDWFYEGFALYQSLKLGVAVNRIRFEDYLDTLSRAYNIDAMQTPRISLIDASKQRFNGANTLVYVRGMLIAFLCDLALMDTSKGKVSTDNLIREIYQKYHGASSATDGNTAILDAMRQHKELNVIADRYMSGSEKIDWNKLLSAAGIEAGVQNSTAVLRVMAKPNGRQKDLLDKLGYNSWRKLTVNNSNNR